MDVRGADSHREDSTTAGGLATTAGSSAALDRFDGSTRNLGRATYGLIVACLGTLSLWSHLTEGVPESLPMALSLFVGGLLLGAVLASARSGARLDFASGTYRAWQGWSLPWIGKRGSLGELRRVDLHHRRVRAVRSTLYVHVISARREGRAPLEIAWLDSYAAARRAAEQLAKRLGVPLCDATSGAEVLRAPEDLDRPLHRRSDRRRRHGKLWLAPLPAGSHLTFTADRSARTLRVWIPAPGLRLDHVAPLVIYAVFAALVMLLPSRRHRPGPQGPLFWSFLCFLGVVLIVLLAGVTASVTRHVTLEAGPEGLHVRWQCWLSRGERRLWRNLIEELVIGQEPSDRPWYVRDFFSDAVLARSDRETISLGGHLTAAEKRWLRDAIEEALAQ